MVIDHIGLFFFPNTLLFRIIGRIAFPIFAWLIANGAHHTSSIRKYLIRLLLFAVIAQPFYYLVNFKLNPTFAQLNILFTLFIGLGAIVAIQKVRNNYLVFIFIVLFAAVAQITKSEYGAMGVLSIVSFYIFYTKKLYMALCQILINTAPFWTLPWVAKAQFYGILFGYIMQLLSLFALMLITAHNGREGRKMKYLIYAIYPMQYVVIYFLQKIIAR